MSGRGGAGQNHHGGCGGDLLSLIEKTILAQTEDQYPFATVYDQELSFYAFRQDNMSTSAQWYERFNTKIDVGNAIGVTRYHKVLLEYCANEHTTGSTFVTYRWSKKDAEERYVSYAFLKQSGRQHGNLWEDLQNSFTTGENRYPKTRQETLHPIRTHFQMMISRSQEWTRRMNHHKSRFMIPTSHQPILLQSRLHQQWNYKSRSLKPQGHQKQHHRLANLHTYPNNPSRWQLHWFGVSR